MRVPRTARRQNQSILMEINTIYSLEGLMLKLQYFGPLMQRDDSLKKTLMLENTKDKKEKSTAEDRGAWPATVHGVTKIQTRLSDSTTAT